MTLTQIIDAADLGALLDDDQPIGIAYEAALLSLRAAERDLTAAEVEELGAALGRLNSCYDDGGYVLDAPRAHVETGVVCDALERIAAWETPDSVRELVDAHRGGRAMLREHADVRHEDAEDWWENLGMCSAVDNSTVHPVCGFEEVEDYKPVSAAEADCLEYGRAAKSDAISIAAALDDAVTAYRSRDLAGVVDALEQASRIEQEYGDDPATKELAAQLVLVSYLRGEG